jgi:hypothetical protein
MNTMQNIDFPQIEFCYETVSHKEIPITYDVCFAIPIAKKNLIWFSIIEGNNVCMIMELNKQKKISSSSVVNTTNKMPNIYTGSVFYGSINDNCDDLQFIVEDILMFKGVSMRHVLFGVKLGIIEKFLELQGKTCDRDRSIRFYLPLFWKSFTGNQITVIPTVIPYLLHHIQYRSLTQISSYLNVFVDNRGMFPWEAETKNISNPKPNHLLRSKLNLDVNIYSPVFSSFPERRGGQTEVSLPPNTNYTIKTKSMGGGENTNTTCKRKNIVNLGKYIFIVIANSQYDIYNLFVSSLDKKPIYYDVAYIPNYKNSVYMNSLFRNIKENKNLDLIEESDDEEDFEDIRDDKYVDFEKTILMECVFHSKFKKWVPIKVFSFECDDINAVVCIDKLPQIF